MVQNLLSTIKMKNKTIKSLREYLIQLKKFKFVVKNHVPNISGVV